MSGPLVLYNGPSLFMSLNFVQWSLTLRVVLNLTSGSLFLVSGPLVFERVFRVRVRVNLRVILTNFFLA